MSYEMDRNRIVPAICTQCSAQIEVDPSRDAAICPHCGTAFIVEKAVKNYVAQNIQTTNVEYIDTVNFNTTPQGHAGSALFYLDRAFERRSRRKLERERLELDKQRIQLKLEKEAREREHEREEERQRGSIVFRFIKFIFFGIFKVIFWVIVGIVVLAILIATR